jgi:type II secretion system protein H
MRLQLHRPHSRKLGFTLIELMVVIVLIAVMTALIIPEMKGTYEDALLRSTARKLVDVCNLANSHAITINQLHRVRLDRKKGRYTIERTTRDGERGSGDVSAREIPGGTGEVDTRISIVIQKTAEEPAETAEPRAPLVSEEKPREQNSDDSIAFYPDGTADAEEIILRDREGFRLALRINPITARIRIVELARE